KDCILPPACEGPSALTKPRFTTEDTEEHRVRHPADPCVTLCPLWLRSWADSSAKRVEGALNAANQRFVSIDQSPGVSDGFESRLHFEIELEVAISSRMRGVILDPAPRSFFRADAFENLPGLMQCSGGRYNIFNLISPRKRTSVKQDNSGRIP